MNKNYTWKDIDRYCRMNESIWKGTFSSIEVYPSEMEIFIRNGEESSLQEMMHKLWGEKYLNDTRQLVLDFPGKTLPVLVDESEESRPKRKARPLFEDIPYYETPYPDWELEELAKPVIAFHSFKGGVGRTLSVIAFAKAWGSVFASDEKQSKLLIVDADMEAPGITWIKEKEDENVLCYFDFLELVQDVRLEELDDMIENVANFLCSSVLMIETPLRRIEHYFMPLYRYTEQLFDIYATPNSLVIHRNKKYILATAFAKLAEKLGCAAVLIDLRAGMSPFSAPILFDPRVKKLLVTSTSRQSIQGTSLILSALLKGINITENTLLPEVFLNMVPSELPEGEKTSILEGLQRLYETDGQSMEYIENVILELPFASELVHETSISQISDALDDRTFYKRIEAYIKDNYKTQIPSGIVQNRQEKLKAISKFAHSRLTAEGSENMNLLLTEPLKNLIRKYKNHLPCTVVTGTKGSGKTFIFRKMLIDREWGTFCNGVLSNLTGIDNTCFLPLLGSANSAKFVNDLKECIEHLNNQIPGIKVEKDVWMKAERLVKQRLEEKKAIDADFWEKMLAKAIFVGYDTLEEANDALRKADKKIIFLIDSLEELCSDIANSPDEQMMIRSLCQDVLTSISVRYSHIGIIMFLRLDLAKASIKVNYEQFERAYSDVALQWSNREALRLAVWLVNEAVPDFFTENIKLEEASDSVIDRYLEKLWGLKLGKANSNEAYSSKWILAALSDFHGHLQARDMIRFLEKASSMGKSSASYEDRLLMPTDIRAAIGDCSKEKLMGVKAEYPSLNDALDKIENLPDEKRYLPLNPQDVALTALEERMMVDEGYLCKIDDKYYFPECIRNALDLKYSKGARPKVLALMRRSENRWL